MRLGKHQKALEDFGRVLTLDPKNAKAYHLRAECYEKLGRMDRAKMDRERAKSLQQSLTETLKEKQNEPSPE